MKTLVLGLGNPILSDDGVGIRVAHEVAGQAHDRQVTVTETSGAGLGLLDFITGYDRVIIIDAIQTKEGTAGQIYRLGREDFSRTRYFSSPHQVNLATALELGNMLGLAMPREITIFAVEARDVTTFSEKCTSEIERVIPEVVNMVINELNEHKEQ
jgi:hydrogenase maturation protease